MTKELSDFLMAELQTMAAIFDENGITGYLVMDIGHAEHRVYIAESLDNVVPHPAMREQAA